MSANLTRSATLKTCWPIKLKGAVHGQTNMLVFPLGMRTAPTTVSQAAQLGRTVVCGSSSKIWAPGKLRAMTVIPNMGPPGLHGKTWLTS